MERGEEELQLKSFLAETYSLRGVTVGVPQRYADYFELKAILASGSRENFAPPLNYLEKLKLGTLPIIKDYQR